MKRPLKWLIGLVLVLVLLAVLYPAISLLTYDQVDDEQHLTAKREYLASLAAVPPSGDRPNIVLILLDDLGYGDLGSFGAQSISTPNIDSLAQAGTRFTHYYSPSPVCSPSRAGLMTGRYPPRAGLGYVVFPGGSHLSNAQKILGAKIRIPADEIMLSEVLKAAGYRTGMVGKWHMGDVAPSLPNDFGFDSYYGGLYSNDMTPFALYRNREIEELAELDQTRVHGLYTREVVRFIEQQDAAAPFFLYYAHHFPHIPLHTSPQQAGKSNAGLYGDVVEDIDNSVGALLSALRRQQLMDNTLILITSDNGPWFQGSAGNVRGRKNQTWEGGQRVPFIAYWADRVPSGATDDTPFSGVDIFPTVLSFLGLPLPSDRRTDGADVSQLLLGASTPEHPLFYYSQTGTTLDAVRGSRFKYHRRRGVRSVGLTDNFDMLRDRGPWLFDLKNDAQESYDVSKKFPQEMRKLQDILMNRLAETEANPRGWVETGSR